MLPHDDCIVAVVTRAEYMGIDDWWWLYVDQVQGDPKCALPHKVSIRSRWLAELLCRYGIVLKAYEWNMASTVDAMVQCGVRTRWKPRAYVHPGWWLDGVVDDDAFCAFFQHMEW